MQVTSTGTISVGAGATLGFAGALTSLGGTIAGAGTLGVAAGVTTLAAGATVTVSTLALYDDGVLSLGGNEILSGAFSEADDATLQLGGHTLTIAGAAQLTGAPEIFHGMLVTKGVTNLNGNVLVGGGVTWNDLGSVTDIHNFQIGDSSGLAATVTIAASDLFNVAAGGVTINTGVGSDTIANAGTLEMTGGGSTSHVEVAVKNAGTITSLNGTLEIDGAVTNSSLITATGGAVAIYGAVANSGSVTASSGSAVDLFGGGTLDGTIGGGGGSVVLGGTFVVAAGQTETVTFASGASFAATGTRTAYLSGAGTFVTKGTVGIGNNGGPALQLENGVLWRSNGIVNDDGDINFGVTSGDSVTLDNNLGATFNVSAEGGIFENNGTTANLENAGTFVKSAGTGVSDIRIAFANTGTIKANSGTLEFDGGGTLGGTIGGGAGEVVLDGTFGVATGATETVAFGAGVSFAAAGTGTAYLSGAGTIATSGTVAIGNNSGAALWLANEVIWRNNGTVNDAGGVNFGVTSGDNVTLENASGARFNVTSEGEIFQDTNSGGGVLANAGTFDKSAGTGVSDIRVAFANTGIISANSGTLEFDDGGTLGGTIGGGAGEIVLDGTFSVATGVTESVAFGAGVSFAAAGTNTAFLSGAGTIATSGTVAIGNNGGAALWLANGVLWRSNGTVNDAGAINFGVSSGDNVTLENVAGATFNVSAAGVIFQNTDSGGGVLANAGTFDKSAGTGVSDIRVAFANTGTISAKSGTLEFDDGGSNAGIVEAQANANLTMEDATVSNTGGVLEAVGANSFLNLYSETINGGALRTSAGGLIEAIAGSNDTLNGVGVGAGSAATLAGGGALSLTGTSALAGTLTLTGSSSLSGTVSGAGTLALAGGGATINSGTTLSVSHWLVSGAGTVATLNEALSYGGAFGEAAGATLALTGGALTLSGSANLKAGTVERKRLVEAILAGSDGLMVAVGH